jgi:hypothetical protein
MQHAKYTSNAYPASIAHMSWFNMFTGHCTAHASTHHCGQESMYIKTVHMVIKQNIRLWYSIHGMHLYIQENTADGGQQ